MGKGRIAGIGATIGELCRGAEDLNDRDAQQHDIDTPDPVVTSDDASDKSMFVLFFSHSEVKKLKS